MRRIKIGLETSWTRVALRAALALGALAGCAAPVAAQNFSFDFTGSGGVVASAIFTLSGGTVYNLSGGLSGVSPGGDDGTIALVSPGSGFFTSSTNYGFNFEVNAPPSNGKYFFALGAPAGGSSIEAVGGSVYLGTSHVAGVTPSPLPGSGPLSYLAFGGAGLFIKRKLLWRTVWMAGDKFGITAPAKLLEGRGAT